MALFATLIAGTFFTSVFANTGDDDSHLWPEVVYHDENSVAPQVVYDLDTALVSDCTGLVPLSGDFEGLVLQQEPHVVYDDEDAIAPDMTGNFDTEQVSDCTGLEAPLDFIFPELQGQMGQQA